MEVFPPLGLGTFLSPRDSRTTEAVRYAIEEAGYRHIDCAAAYHNEEFVGAALKDVISRGVVKREELWITSKLWCDSFAPEEVEPACRTSLQKLGLDYLDLYLLHWPFALEKSTDPLVHLPFRAPKQLATKPNDYLATYRAAAKLVGLGLIRRLGVSNLTIGILEKVRFAPDIAVQPYTNQVEMHLYMQNEALVRYSEFRGITVTGWGCIGQGENRAGGRVPILDDPVLKEVAEEVGRPPANVLIRFLQQLSPVVIVLVKSITPERIKSNAQLDFDLSEEQLKRLKGRERCQRLTSRLTNWGIDVFGDEW
jgi:diketogulonate reductase-like aldo/keto reductase